MFFNEDDRISDRNEKLKKKAQKGIPFLEIFTKGELRAKNRSFRNSITNHARRTYLNSNKPKQCLICGYDRHIEICHIRAVSDFSDDAFIGEINDPVNLMALCPTHHWEFDNGLLDFNYLDTDLNSY